MDNRNREDTLRAADVVAAVRRGDDAAFARLVLEYQAAVYNLCYRMLGSAHDAEDATQETFLRAFRQLHQYDAGRSFKTWLFAIASHGCIDELRKRHGIWLDLDAQPSLRHPALRESAAGPEELAMRGEQQTKIQALLGALPPRDRSAIVMRYWEDFSYQEIADATGDSVAAVKSRLHRARVALGEMLTSGDGAAAAPHSPAAGSVPYHVARAKSPHLAGFAGPIGNAA